MAYRFGFGNYTPSFPLPSPMSARDGSQWSWLGGDGGYECALDSTRSVWTFGDSYWGPPGATARQGSVVLGSVVGVGTCSGGAWSLSLHCGGSSARPLPYFDDPTNTALGTRFAPLKPFLWGGKLYVVLVRAADGPGPYNPTGATVIARVNDPSADAVAWAVDYLELSPGPLILGVEAVVVGADLVLIGSDRGGGNWPVKLPLAVLAACPAGADLVSSLEYWDGSGWLPGVTGPGAVDCGIVTTSGLSVQFNGVFWVACWVDTTSHDGFPGWINVATAGSPFGPWTEPRRLYAPEMAPASPSFNPDNVIYGVHEVKDFEDDPKWGAIRVGYSVGSLAALTAGDFTRQLADLSVYRVGDLTAPEPFA